MAMDAQVAAAAQLPERASLFDVIKQRYDMSKDPAHPFIMRVLLLGKNFINNNNHGQNSGKNTEGKAYFDAAVLEELARRAPAEADARNPMTRAGGSKGKSDNNNNNNNNDSEDDEAAFLGGGFRAAGQEEDEGVASVLLDYDGGWFLQLVEGPDTHVLKYVSLLAALNGIQGPGAGSLVAPAPPPSSSSTSAGAAGANAHSNSISLNNNNNSANTTNNVSSMTAGGSVTSYAAATGGGGGGGGAASAAAAAPSKPFADISVLYIDDDIQKPSCKGWMAIDKVPPSSLLSNNNSSSGGGGNDAAELTEDEVTEAVVQDLEKIVELAARAASAAGNGGGNGSNNNARVVFADSAKMNYPKLFPKLESLENYERCHHLFFTLAEFTSLFCAFPNYDRSNEINHPAEDPLKY